MTLLEKRVRRVLRKHRFCDSIIFWQDVYKANYDSKHYAVSHYTVVRLASFNVIVSSELGNCVIYVGAVSSVSTNAVFGGVGLLLVEGNSSILFARVWRLFVSEYTAAFF